MCCFVRLLDYNVETAVVVIVEGSATLNIDTQYVKLNYRVGSIYQFIGELSFELENQVRLVVQPIFGLLEG